MKHCVPVTITGICVCKRAGNYLRRVVARLIPLSRYVRVWSEKRMRETRRDAIYLLGKGDSNNVARTTARGTTPRRIGAFQRAHGE